MKIVVRQYYAREWTAIDEDSYVDISSPMGIGKSRGAAIDDLLAQLNERAEAEGRSDEG